MKHGNEGFVSAWIAPLRNQIANLVTRAVLTVIDNQPAVQRLQVTAEEGLIEDVEHFQPYGLSSVPVADAQGVVLCSGGDRAVPIAVVVSEPETRPTGQVAGEVALYHRNGHVIHLRDNGDIEIQCGAGQKIFLNDGSGGAAVATLTDVEAVQAALDGHKHAYISPAPPYVGPVVTTTANPVVPAPTGTQVGWIK